MLVENTEKNQAVMNVAATLAIENMYLSKDFIEKLIKVSNREMTSEDLRNEIIKHYGL
ncbi:MAG: antitoxin VbhA family protein [Desulfovibrionaceae bacterium]|nr:antitoxin VbhA family protein [Desulfovibrionaceae bacterium]